MFMQTVESRDAIHVSKCTSINNAISTNTNGKPDQQQQQRLILHFLCLKLIENQWDCNTLYVKAQASDD